MKTLKELIINTADDNRPHVDVNIFGETLSGLLDSGANTTILGSGAMKLINRLNLRATPLNAIVKTADGTQHVLSSAVEVPFEFNNKCRIILTLILPTLTKPLILGMDFWTAFNIKPIVCNSLDTINELPTNRHTLNPTQMKRLENSIAMFPTTRNGKLGCTTLIMHQIDTGDAQPVKQRHYPVSPYIQRDIDIEIERMLNLGVIEKASGSWSSPMVAVRKNTGKIRLCLDARKLNDLTVKDAYPLPNIARILGRLSGTRFLSAIDLSDAFWQIPLDQSSRQKTAFAISGKGYYQFCRMPFGLCNAASSLVKLMDQVIGCDLEPQVFTYLDDLIIASENFEEHVQLLEEVATRLTAAGLTINVIKSNFCVKELKFLGYIVNEDGLKTDPEKVSAVINYPAPNNIKEVRRFLGMAGWYRRFIKEFATSTAPITDLLKKSKAKFTWTEEANTAFLELKAALISAPVLANPNYEQPFCVQTDASDTGMGAVLVQGQGDKERVIAYFSQKFTSAQRKYMTTERECLAVLTAIEKFRAYVEGTRFTVITDHASLLWLRNLKDPAGRLGRWALRMQAYDFELVHRKGKTNIVPDALSRSVNIIDFELIEPSADPWYHDKLSKIASNPTEHPNYRIEKSTILQFVPQKGPRGIYYNEWRRLVPASMKERILKENHDDPLSAHMGYHKTLHKIKSRYTWPRMAADIREYIRNCDVCAASKASNQVLRAPMGNQKIVDRPWQIISLDFIGPLPRSKTGYCYILVIVDSYSKFTLIKPLRKATAKATTDFLEKEVFLKFCVPEIIISDNGPQFKSKEFRDLLTKRKVKHWATTYYHPQANPSEAANKIIGNSIRAYVDTDHRTWDAKLAEIACAMNTSLHSATKMTPYRALFGHEMIINGNEYQTMTNSPRESDDKVEEEFEKLQKALTENLKRAHESSKKRYDLRSRPVRFTKDQIVWRRNFVLSDAIKGFSSKLAPKFIKCKIIEVLGNNSFRVKDIDGKYTGHFSAQDLKPN